MLFAPFHVKSAMGIIPDIVAALVVPFPANIEISVQILHLLNVLIISGTGKEREEFMNRSKIMEIKKSMKITMEDMPSIDTICTCFVNGNKEKLISNTERYRDLDEEEQFKYIELLSASMTGAVGKKLINLAYDNSPESMNAQKQMQNNYKQIFADDTARDEFFDNIINTLVFDENYLIIAGHGLYDAPVKTSDGAKLEDETDIYEFMLVVICPVHSTKAGLTLDSQTGRMISSTQVQIVQAPINGFLYPAFNDRQTDLSGMLYFTKKPEENHPEFIEMLLGTPAPTSSVEQQGIFENMIAELADDKADFEVIKTLHDNLKEMTENAQMEAVDKQLDKEDIKNIFKDAGISDERLADFDHVYARAGGTDNTIFAPQNLMEIDKFNVKAPDVEIKIKPDRTGLIQKKKVDGKNCIVVTLEGDIELNGIQVSAT